MININNQTITLPIEYLEQYHYMEVFYIVMILIIILLLMSIFIYYKIFLFIKLYDGVIDDIKELKKKVNK